MLKSRARQVFALAIGVLALAPAVAAAQEIEGQYIVVMKSDSSVTDTAQAKKKVRTGGGQVEHEFSTVLKGFSAELDKQALAAVRKNPDVAYVEPDRVMSIEQQSGATWGLDRIDQRALPLNGTYTYGTRTGEGVKAYIIDTGIRTAHAEFSGRVAAGFDAVDGGAADDCNGHGTHVAGTVGGSTYGVAKRVKLIPVRVLDCSGSGSNSGVIAGVDWVTSNHLAGEPAVANMSLGGGASAALDAAVRRSIADGVTYALAAGNSNANACSTSPARTAEALTVGATANNDARASFSNFGTCVDLFAPGQNITSAWWTSNSATTTISGTSMASPHVAGAAVLVLQGTPSALPAAVNSAVIAAATTNVVTNPGTGSPNRLLFSGTATPPPPPPPPTPTPTPVPTCAALAFTGALSGNGDLDILPSGGSYVSAANGTHKGCLRGPAGTDFDLYLQKWNGTAWMRVASSTSYSSTETMSYSGTPGEYRWQIVSYSGSGSYTFEMTKPA